MSRDLEMRSLAIAIGRCSTAQLRDLRIRTEAMLRVDSPDLAIPVSGSAPPSGESPPPNDITSDGGADPLLRHANSFGPVTPGSRSIAEVSEGVSPFETASAYGAGGDLQTSGQPLSGTTGRGHETAGAVSLISGGETVDTTALKPLPNNGATTESSRPSPLQSVGRAGSSPALRTVRIPAKGTQPPPVTPVQVMASARADVVPRFVIEVAELDDVTISYDAAPIDAVNRTRKETDSHYRGKR